MLWSGKFENVFILFIGTNNDSRLTTHGYGFEILYSIALWKTFEINWNLVEKWVNQGFEFHISFHQIAITNYKSFFSFHFGFRNGTNNLFSSYGYWWGLDFLEGDKLWTVFTEHIWHNLWISLVYLIKEFMTSLSSTNSKGFGIESAPVHGRT